MHAELLELNDRLVQSLNTRTAKLLRALQLLSTYCPQLSIDELAIDTQQVYSLFQLFSIPSSL